MQESFFYWSTDGNEKYFIDSEETYPIDAHYPRPEIKYSAFTVAELCNLLPKRILETERLHIDIQEDDWRVIYPIG